MTLTRRGLIKNALIAAAAMAEARRAAAAASRSTPPALRVYDSRVPVSGAWIGDHGEGVIDVAEEHASRWVRLRRVAPAGRVAGLTTWSDFVQVRGLLQEKGKRLRHESRSGNLFYWEMV